MQLIQRFNPQPEAVGPLVPQIGTFVPDHGCNGFGWMDWQPEALAALKKDVPSVSYTHLTLPTIA